MSSKTVRCYFLPLVKQEKMKANYSFFNLILILVFVFIATNIAFGAIDQNKIAGLWLFDESSGDIARDLSGKGHDGKITGAQRVAGKFGNALEFKGKDFVTVFTK